MANDFIPEPDSDFHKWFNGHKSWCAVSGTARGLSAAEVAALAQAFEVWNAAYTAHLAAQTDARARLQAKRDARAAAQALLRISARKLQASAEMTDGERAEAGLPVRSKGRRAAAAPVTRPLARVDTSERLRHVIHFRDVTTPHARRKPPGVRAVEIRFFLGANPPANPAECPFLAQASSTPYVAEFKGAQAGQTAHYALRWVSTRGEFGPWSETVSATVGA